MPSPSSSAQQALEALGVRLREIRIDAGLTGRDLGRLTGWHSSKVSKIEYAKQTPTPDDIRAWCRHCGMPDQAADLIASLRAAEGMFVEWRRLESTGLRLAQEAVVPLWERTKRFRIYNPRLIPGPVQTREYIRALMLGLMDRRGIPDDLDAAVQVRMDKQRVVREGDHRFAIVLEEAVLRFPIGGQATMVGQLGHLLACTALPSVSLGIIPLGVDRSTMWPVEGFWMFDEEQVSAELTSGHLTVTQPCEIAVYGDAFVRLAKLAVYGSAARTLITSAVNALDE
ncbi:helix-turn-helix protein [Micromonospora pisi]|uniref:Helix-turn-helix protein n=1 Tax=Micromonospora pisi TaxID=589240 RepID=A0A495JKU8_9ACTN|nr:helix-turn-helix transcriptional regulator [Micromonospora pisi]RKR89533.1 helix-turn-helix protein [Micromonospora pisi]